AYESAKQERAKIAGQVGFLTVNLGGLSGDVTVNGRAVSPEERAEPVIVDPGSAEVILQSPNHPPIRKTVVVNAGGKVSVSMAPDAPPPKGHQAKSMHPFDMGTGQLITGIAFAGVGVIGMGLFIGFGAANQSIYSDLQDQCPDGRCPSTSKDDADKGQTYQTV